jgi:hypothetical protein
MEHFDLYDTYLMRNCAEESCVIDLVLVNMNYFEYLKRFDYYLMILDEADELKALIDSVALDVCPD